MNKLKTFSILAFSLIFLAACFDSDSDDNNGGGAGGNGDMPFAGSYDTIFEEANATTKPAPFINGESVTVIIEANGTLKLNGTTIANEFGYNETPDTPLGTMKGYAWANAATLETYTITVYNDETQFKEIMVANDEGFVGNLNVQ